MLKFKRRNPNLHLIDDDAEIWGAVLERTNKYLFGVSFEADINDFYLARNYAEARKELLDDINEVEDKEV